MSDDKALARIAALKSGEPAAAASLSLAEAFVWATGPGSVEPVQWGVAGADRAAGGD